MESFSFKKLRFFRSEESRIKKIKNNAQVPDPDEKTSLMQRLLGHHHIFLIIFALAIAYLASYQPSKSLPEWEIGAIAPADVVIPEDLTIEDKETIQTRRQEAEDREPPVYSLNSNAFLSARIKIRKFFESGRALIAEPPDSERQSEFIKTSSETHFIELTPQILRNLIKLEFSPTLEESLITLISDVMDRGIIINKNLYTHNEQELGFILIRGAAAESKQFVSTVLDKEEAKTILANEINLLELPDEEKSVLTALAYTFLTANVDFNASETAFRRELARRSVETTYFTIKKGKVVIRKGDEVTDDILRDIRDYNQNLSAQPNWLINFAGSLILFSLLLYGLLYYLQSGRDPEVALNRFTLICTILIIGLLLFKVSASLSSLISHNTSLTFFSYAESYRYGFPVQMGALLVTFLVGVHLALFFVIFISILFGFLFNSELLMIFTLVGGFAAILGVRLLGKSTRTPVLRAGILFVAPVNVAAITALHLLRGGISAWQPFISEAFMGILGGVISSALAFLLLPVLENIFSIVTPAKLVELTNSDLPIFRKMALEAPGSYHHSLVVASLAEAAAEDIDLDPMLVKAGALYHDIGKIKRPEYFIENLTRNFDMHRDLKPSMSSLVIINHVKEGVEQATKLRLPKRVKDLIAQHHGNSLVRYFFEKAKEEYDPEMQTIGEESYRYPGPRPRTKEAALVMLADSVEAASRSLRNPSKANLKRLISEIFNSNLQDGQLDESRFSLSELKIMANAFLLSLDTIYHPRVEYPGFEFEIKRGKPAAPHKNNDRNP
ncbi:MAG: HDIG domain-containing metalloprotein [Candidatus Aminicenantaceae bacterium]